MKSSRSEVEFKDIAWTYILNLSARLVYLLLTISQDKNNPHFQESYGPDLHTCDELVSHGHVHP
jgi:hypothetical protein